MRRWLHTLALLSVSCAAPEYVAGLRKPVPVSTDVVHAEARFEAGDGTSLFGQTWRPKRPSRAALVIMHGLKDHSGRYADFAEKLTRRGFSVHAFDLRGHGDSAGRRVWVEDFSEYVDDLEQFVRAVHESEAGKPVFLFGHSMGGAISTLYALREHSLAGLILSGAALRVGNDIGAFARGATRALGTITPSLAVLGLPNEDFSRDPDVVEAMTNDPLIYQGKGPARTAKQLLAGIARIQEQMEDVTLPLLILHGSEDKLTPVKGSIDLKERSRSKDKTYRLYVGFWHDLLHEPDHARVEKDIFSWLEKRAPATR